MKRYDELLEQKNVRANLSALRQMGRDGEDREELIGFLSENEELFLGFLENEDAKTRKNAALLFKDLNYERARDALYACYRKEETLFVKSAYLQALAGMDVSPMLEELRGQLLCLQKTPLTQENRKHVTEEIRALRAIMIRYDGIDRHTFDIKQRGNQVLLVTNRNHREVVRRMVPGASLHPLGVWVQTDDLPALLQVRTYRELLFPMGERAIVPAEPAAAAEQLAPWMLSLCRRCHKEEGSFYFRVECQGVRTLEERSTLTRRLGAYLEEQTNGGLVNSPKDYEVELRLVESREGAFFPCLKFYTLPDHRFDYRRHAISASIHPSTAALIAELAKPYLKENAQVMDPFCGVGTMLIERDIAVPAKEKYATDIFGDAIAYGRENAHHAGMDIHFIHRDYFDFRHEYPFDEIITNMPLRGKRTKEEMDKLYGAFFDKSKEILATEAVLVMYTNEIGFVKKHLRLRAEYRLLQETCMQKRSGFYLLVIGYDARRKGGSSKHAAVV